MLAEPLEALGAEILFVPVIEIADPTESTPLEQAIQNLASYDWLIFTSVNGVRHFVEALDRSDRDLRDLNAKLCAIGSSTRAAVEALHLRVDVMPEEYVAKSLLEALAGEDLRGKRILLPRAAVARDLVPVTLRERGAVVDVVEAYRTIIPADAVARAKEALGHKPDWITFTSSSTVTNLLAVTGREALAGIKIASIGPVTSATAREAGLTVDVEAEPHTIEGLVEAIAKTPVSR
jgi:uroporphyrinogen III methyltransferase/synthase